MNKVSVFLLIAAIVCNIFSIGSAEKSLHEEYPDGARILVIGGRDTEKEFSNEPYVFPDSKTEHLMRTVMQRKNDDVITYKDISNISEFRIYGKTAEEAEEYISVLKFFPWLRTVEIVDCGLKSIPVELTETQVESLWLNGNDLRDISALKNMKSLTTLELTGNNFITDYSPLANLENLTSIYLNLFSTGDISAIANCKKLTRISLQGNFISYEGKGAYSAQSYCVPFEDASFLNELPLLEKVYISGFSEISEAAFEQIENSTTTADISIRMYNGEPNNLYDDLKNGMNIDWRGEDVLHGLSKEDVLAFYKESK